MPPPPAEIFHDWHDFYMLAGEASATLVALMFVAASIGASLFSEEHSTPMKAFLTPTVVHFASVLFMSLLVIMPTHSWLSLGVLLGAEGLLGSIYCGGILVQIIVQRRFNVDMIDRVFYALIPMLGYFMVSASAVLVLLQDRASAILMAVALLTLLVAGIRNAWDMTLWIAIRAPTGRGPAPPAA